MLLNGFGCLVFVVCVVLFFPGKVEETHLITHLGYTMDTPEETCFVFFCFGYIPYMKLGRSFKFGLKRIC